jgi:hypothetical protein
MNPLIEEYLAEEHRKDIQREFAQIRLQEQASKGKVFRPNWFTRSMQKLGQLLIVQGEGLVKRYEVPTKKPCQQTKRSYAH